MDGGVGDNGLVSPEPLADDPRLTAFFLGGATVVAQALLVREAMAALGGAEVAWGVVMALWLAGMAGGARLGIQFGSLRLAAWLPTIVLVLAGLGVVTLRLAPAVIGAAPGEAVTTGSAVWLWALAILPAAIAGGVAFPTLALALGASGGGRAYGFEALGALVGGVLLSIGLVHIGAAGAACLALGVVAAGAAWQRRSSSAAILAVVAIAFAAHAGDALARSEWKWSDRPGTLRSWFETRYQKIAISDGPPTSVYGDGRLLASYPDPWSVMPRAHLLMLLHPAPRNVFALGCVVDGSVEAMAAHPVDRLTVVEEDPDLLRALPTLYGVEMEAALKRPHVRAVASDPLRALTTRSDWDLVILLDGNPLTLRHNRTRTLEFLRRCRAHMRPDGVLVLRVAVPDTYIGGAGGRLLSVIASTVQRVFKQLVLIPGSDTLIVAGGPEADLDLDPEILAGRYERRRVAGPGLQPGMIPLLLDPERSRTLTAELPLDSLPNTIERPRAVLLANRLHEARVLPGLLTAARAIEESSDWSAAAVFGGIALLVFAGATLRRIAPTVAAATVGFCSMGWWLVLIAVWQSTRGSVYSEIGALTGIFMAGVAVGSLVASRWQRPEKGLPFILLGGSAVSAAIAAGAAVAVPMVAVPGLLVAGGALTGAAFPGLARLGGRHTRRDAGAAFAADEAGAAAAAVTIGVVVIPWAGLSITAIGLAILLVAAIPAVVWRRR